MFPMTITIANPAQLSAVMAALNVDQIMATPAPAPAEKSEPKQGKPAKETVANGTSSSPTVSSTSLSSGDAAAQEPAPAAATPAAPVAASVTYEDAKAAITKLANTKGRDATVALLKTFGAAKGPDLKPDQYAAFIAAANEAAGA